MHTRILTIVLILLASVSAARGQPGEVVLPAHAPDEAPEAKRWHALFGGKEREQHLPESAEEAEDHKERPLRMWLRAEYLTWWIRSANAPVIATTGDPADTVPGALNSAATTPLFGGSGQDFFDRKGGRFSGGWWFDDERVFGLEASYFFLSGRPVNANFISDEVPLRPVLANPFFNVNTGQPDAALVAFPGVMTGRIFIDMPTFLQGAEGNLSATLWHGEHWRIEALAGFRWVNLREGLHITSTSFVQLAPQFQGLGIPFDGNTITVGDRFDTHNNFYGGNLGARVEFHNKRWTLDLLGKVAIGGTRELVQVHGGTTIDTQPMFVSGGGLYALATNSGDFARNTFAVVPEANVNLKFEINEHVRVFAGYTFLYWSRVARPGDQVDTSINPNFIPTSATFGGGGVARPAFNLRSTDFWAHGVNIGMEIRY